MGFVYWLFQDLTTWYYVGLNIASIVAVTQKGKEMFGFSFILLDFFRRREGQVISKSVIQGGSGLIGSGKVACVLIMMFGCLGFWWFEDEINEFNDCTTAFQCIYQSMEAGLRGDIAGVHGNDFSDVLLAFPTEINKDIKKQFQFWFVTIFFLLWSYVLAGIVQGYIVDAFSMIRAVEIARERDSTKNCLVCSLSKFELQRVGVDFDEHIEEAHNRWSYLYLASAVRSEAPKGWLGTTGAIVKSALEQNSVEFMPLESSVELNLLDFDGRDRIDIAASNLEDLSEHVLRLEESIAAIDAKVQNVSEAVARAAPDEP